MSTRAVVCFKQPRGWRAYYRHHDGYPTGLGWELYNYLRSHPDAARIIATDYTTITPRCFEFLRLSSFTPPVLRAPEHAFDAQGDLEYIYSVERYNRYNEDTDTVRIGVYRTSNPFISKSFVVPVLTIFTEQSPSEVYTLLSAIETSVEATLRILSEIHEQG